MKSNLHSLAVTVFDRLAPEGEKFKQVDLYGKAALSATKVFGSSKFLSGNVADVMIDQKINPETKEPAEGFIGAIRYTQDAEGAEIAEKDRRYSVRIDSLTFKTETKEKAEYKVSKPVKRTGDGTVTNLQDIENSHGKTIGIKSILDAMNENGECFLVVEKTKIQDRDTWFIKDAAKLQDPAADKGEKARYSITVTSPEAGRILIAGAEIKDSEPLKEYIKNDLGGKWNSKEKGWDAALPEGMTAGKMFYQVIEKARELHVQPAESSVKGMAENAPEGGSVKDALKQLDTPSSSPALKQ